MAPSYAMSESWYQSNPKPKREAIIAMGLGISLQKYNELKPKMTRAGLRARPPGVTFRGARMFKEFPKAVRRFCNDVPEIGVCCENCPSAWWKEAILLIIQRHSTHASSHLTPSTLDPTPDLLKNEDRSKIKLKDKANGAETGNATHKIKKERAHNKEMEDSAAARKQKKKELKERLAKQEVEKERPKPTIPPPIPPPIALLAKATSVENRTGNTIQGETSQQASHVARNDQKHVRDLNKSEGSKWDALIIRTSLYGSKSGEVVMGSEIVTKDKKRLSFERFKACLRSRPNPPRHLNQNRVYVVDPTTKERLPIRCELAFHGLIDQCMKSQNIVHVLVEGRNHQGYGRPRNRYQAHNQMQRAA